MSEESGFTQALRGYNRDEVDHAIAELRDALVTAQTNYVEAQKEIKAALAASQFLIPGVRRLTRLGDPASAPVSPELTEAVGA